MSDKTDVPVDSKTPVQENVVNDDATSPIAQACVDATKIDNSVNDCTGVTTCQVPDVSTREDTDIKLGDPNSLPNSSFSHDDVTSVIVENLKVDPAEEVNSVDKNVTSPSSPDSVIVCNLETDRPEGSDDGSDYKDAVVIKDVGHDISDSESEAGSDSSVEGFGTGRRNRLGSNEISKDNYSDDDSISKEGVEYEPQGARESGDGEEKNKDKAVDRDEDKKDPQYIPKKGVFYEHDDRTAESGPANPTEEPKETKKKKVVADKIDKWGHDMYDTAKQSPKSTQDLIDYYGYDIRNEEEPPKAWRSRRYGRGPNKYTRQWQDEAAYRNKRSQINKPPPPPSTPFKNNIDDFPTVEQSKSGYRRTKSKSSIKDTAGRDKGRYPNKMHICKDQRPDSRNRPHSDETPPSPPSNTEPLFTDGALTSMDSSKYKDIQIEKTVFLNKKKPFSSTKTKSDAEAEADLAALSKEFSNAVINLGRDGKILPIGSHTLPGNPNSSVQKSDKIELKEVHSEPNASHQHNPSGGAEVRVKERRDASQSGGSSSKSKRYSSQRQRSLPQSNHLQQQQTPPQQQQQQFLHQQQFFPPPPPAPAENVADSALFSSFQGNPPPVYTDSMQGVVFLPGYPPTPPPHLLNYCPAPQQFGMPPPPPLGPPPPDMFPAQPPPGITYYSPQSQVQSRPPASRRVKVAIPIVAPPDQQPQPDQTCS